MITMENTSAGYVVAGGEVRAVAGISLSVNDNEILGIAGESGCGKSTLLKLMYGQIGSGLTLFEGDIRWSTDSDGNETIGSNDVRQLWWDQITYVPQVVNILNPVQTVGSQIIDSMPKRLLKKGQRELQNDLNSFFAKLGLSESVFSSYPHQLSGGMIQRVLVGLAAFTQPRMILADEPTTALDVVSQKKILLLLHTIQREQKNALVIVSHDLGVHFQITDRIAICYAGHIVEIGPTRDVLERPAHPYTKGLINALPRIDDTKRKTGLDGRPPSLMNPPTGCRFAERCSSATAICSSTMPQLRQIDDQQVACHHAGES